MNLKITNRVLVNDNYIRELKLLAELEQERIFCGHNMEHFLNVARIALIMCHEKGIIVEPDIIYTASLLHDIGRTDEYINGTSHDKAGVYKAGIILDEVDCDAEMKEKILCIIRNHRNKNKDKHSLEHIFYMADKKSRLCFCCPAQKQCNWSEEKKNRTIEV